MGLKVGFSEGWEVGWIVGLPVVVLRCKPNALRVVEMVVGDGVVSSSSSSSGKDCPFVLRVTPSMGDGPGT